MSDQIVRTVSLEEITCKETKTAKNGNLYCSVYIKVGGKSYGGLMWGDNIDIAKTWKQGSSIMLVFFQEEYQGKMYAKFKLPTKTDLIYNEINALKAKLKLIMDHLNLKL